MRIDTVTSALHRCLVWCETDMQKASTRGNYKSTKLGMLEALDLAERIAGLLRQKLGDSAPAQKVSVQSPFDPELVAQIICAKLNEPVDTKTAMHTDKCKVSIISDTAKTSGIGESIEPDSADQQALLDYLMSGARKLNTATWISEKYDMDVIEFNKYLSDRGIQRRASDGSWTLCDPYINKGYATHSQIFPDSSIPRTMYWTKSGLKFLFKWLGRHGIYPVIHIDD